MTKFVEKYFAPIIGDEKATLLEDFAMKLEQGKIKDDVKVENVFYDIVYGTRLDFVDLLKPVTRKPTQATIDKRYAKALAKLNEKYGKGGND